MEQIAQNARHVLISVNPCAGAQNRQAIVEELRRHVEKRALECSIVTDIETLSQKATELSAAGHLRAVVAAGGDGTFRLVAARVPCGTALFPLPLGTENLLARYLEITVDAERCARILAEGWTIQHDAGEAGGRLFALMVGCGFDADVVRRLHAQRQGHIHHWSYAKPILDAIRKYEYPALRLYYAPADADSVNAELTHEISARWAFVVNVPRYAGGLSLAPWANANDGLLDICTFKEGSLWYGLMYLGGILLGQHESMHDFTRVRTRRLRIESEGKVPYQVDGDPGGDLPIDIRVLQSRLRLVVSQQWAVQLESSAATVPSDPLPAFGK
jgi:diacylglycerol kinase (ATP)